MLAFFMSKYNEDGRAAKNRLEANAYPRVKFGYSVAWNGLRVPSCGFNAPQDSKGDDKAPKAKRAVPRLDYSEGLLVKCALNPFRARVTTVKTSVNGSATEVPKVEYFHAADGPGYTHKIPRVPKPTLYRPSFAVTITKTTSVGAARFSSDYEKYKNMLRSGRPPGPKPVAMYEPTEMAAPLMTTDKFGKTGEVLVIWKTVYTSTIPVETSAGVPSTTPMATNIGSSSSRSTADSSQSKSIAGLLSTTGTTSTAISTSVDSTNTTGPSGTQTPSSTTTPAPSQ
ncbi:hypothetical protein TWF192_007282 [Orbilia oligospora]|nr:hypothetical protein TWF192_007282 [Orbilia oligospora]